MQAFINSPQPTISDEETVLRLTRTHETAVLLLRNILVGAYEEDKINLVTYKLMRALAELAAELNLASGSLAHSFDAISTPQKPI